MVSVVVIAYNVKEYIGKCIESIIGQTYSNIEIIIIDNNSEDGTSDICKKYADLDNRINYIYKENQGPGVARTIGVRECTGKYIMFVDGDDWLEDDAVEVLYKKAEQYQADITLGDMLYIYKYVDKCLQTERIMTSYSKMRLDERTCISGINDASVINKCRTYTCGKLFRTEFLRVNEFEQDLFAYEDLATVPVLVACAEKIAYVNKPVYNYLKNRSTSLVNDKKHAKEIIDALKELHKGFLGLEDYAHYIDELKRLMWGQVRFVCLKHPTCMEVENDYEVSLYEELSSILKEYFQDFIPPEQCDVRIINAKFARKLLKNIMISDRRVIDIVNEVDCKKRILVSIGNQIKEYPLDYISEKDVEDESRMWDIVDDIFRKIW